MPKADTNTGKIRVICTVTNDLVFDQRMQRIGTSLQQNGYFVELVGRTWQDSPPVVTLPFLQTRLSCFFNKGFLFYAEYNIRLFFYLLLNTFDIVCGCDLDTLPAAWLAARIKGRKVVYDAHEYFPESPELIGRVLKQNIWYLIERWTVPRVDAMYTVTESIADIFRKKYNIPVRVVRNLPFSNAEMPAVNAERQLLYQGAVNIGRGLNEMLLVMLKIEGCPFLIAGDGDEMEHIRFSVQKLHLENKVKLLGKQTPQQLKNITQNAYIGINLLENRGLSYYYSLGNKTFDYIQAGIPQVMIGFPEYIALNEKYQVGIIVDELSVEKIYHAIQRLLQDEELYRQLQQNCLKARVSLCWENEVKHLLAVYKKLDS